MLFRDANPPLTRRKSSTTSSDDSPTTRRKSTPIFTPSDIHRTLTQLISSCGELSNVRVSGELVNVSPKTRAGHMYFDVKDSVGSKLSCTLFGVDRVLSHDAQQKRLVNGAQVVVRGAIRCSCKYKGSQYQCNVRDVQWTATEDGANEKQLAKWEADLTQEGVFEPARKQPVPEYPRRVAIVTSEGGAALQDVKQTLADATVPFSITVYPCTVQGDTCVSSVLRQLDTICDLCRTTPNQAPDLVLVTRGGGSREDLWAFNEPGLIRGVDVRRAVGHLPPIVCAIGHQVDTPLLDKVCDRSYITPTYAAQALARPFASLYQTLHTRHTQLQQRLRHLTTTYHQSCTQLARCVRQFNVYQHVRTVVSQRHQRIRYLLKQQLHHHLHTVNTLHQQVTASTPWHALTQQTNLAVLKKDNRVDDFDVNTFKEGKRGTVVLVTGEGEVVLHYRVGV